MKQKDLEFWSNITLKELKRAVDFAEESGVSEFKTIAIGFSPNFGLGHGLFVSKTFDQEDAVLKDIMEVDAI